MPATEASKAKKDKFLRNEANRSFVFNRSCRRSQETDLEQPVNVAAECSAAIPSAGSGATGRPGVYTCWSIALYQFLGFCGNSY